MEKSNSKGIVKFVVNPALIESITLSRRTKTDFFKWTEYSDYTSIFGREKHKKVGWAWRRCCPDYVEEYRSDSDLIETYPNFSIENKVLYIKPHVEITYVSGRKETVWFPNDEMAGIYWHRTLGVVPDFRDISSPIDYTDV